VNRHTLHGIPRQIFGNTEHEWPSGALELHVPNAGHFALETNAREIAGYIVNFLSSLGF
jgi:hypothetical protein